MAFHTAMTTTGNVTIFNTIAGKGAAYSLPVFAKKKGKYWFTYTPHLRILGYSKKTKKDAVKDWKKSAKLFFNVHLKRDTLEAALYHFGWASEATTQGVYRHPKYSEVPIELLASQESGKYQMASA